MPIQKMMRGTILRKGKNDFYAPPAGQSYRWKHWVTEHDIKVCVVCKTAHGKIYAMDETVDAAPPLHFNCRCEICAMNSVIAGLGTKDGTDGADWWIKYNGDCRSKILVGKKCMPAAINPGNHLGTMHRT